MKIITKFNINQRLFTFHENMPRIFTVRNIQVNVLLDKTTISYTGVFNSVNEKQKEKAPGFIGQISSQSEGRYFTLNENQLFAYKEELIETLNAILDEESRK
jgi:hypothetical protein